MAEHRYQQYCALARALDIAGDRWTRLIVRELGPGPRRFTDLIDGLPGISRNLLTERLRGLERDRVIARRDLPPPAARQVYELTDDGRDLAAAMGPLISWGARRIGEPQPGEAFHPRWPAMAMAALADREAAKGVAETYQYVVGETEFHFVIDDGSVELHDGRTSDPAVVVTTDEETWAAVVSGSVKTDAAVSAGSLTFSGKRDATKRLRKIFARGPMLARGRASSRAAA